MKLKALKSAFPFTIPVMMGYLFLGIAFGVLLSSKGYGVQWAFFMSIIIYAGSMQFVAVDLLCSVFNPLAAAIVTLMVNARHLFYGLSMLERFKECKKTKLYMIFSLTDETYSLLCSTKTPEGVDKQWFMFFIALLNQSYWIIGGVLGAWVGSLFRFDSTGIDFAMTALFIVIFVEQWESTKNHWPALLGLGVTFLALRWVGSDWFIIVAMVGILFLLSIVRSKMEGEKAV